MIDLHCHILSGMDDGARSAEESLAMAEMAISDGITHVVATPHSSNEYRFDFAAVRRTALAWITRGLVHFVASDAHNLTSRPHKLRAAYDVVRAEFGEEKAEALFLTNPLAAFEGRPLPHVPEIVEEQAKKKWFLF